MVGFVSVRLPTVVVLAPSVRVAFPSPIVTLDKNEFGKVADTDETLALSSVRLPMFGELAPRDTVVLPNWTVLLASPEFGIDVLMADDGMLIVVLLAAVN